MCMKKIVVVGNGGFAHEVKFIIDRLNIVHNEWRFLGYIDCEQGEDVVGDDSFVMESKSELYVAIGIGNPEIRYRIATRYETNANVVFPNLIDPSAVLSNNVLMGKGNIICANTVLTVDIKMGSFNIVNLSCTVGHNADIKDFCTLNPSSSISGNVLIEDGCNIGTGVKIIQGRRIGARSIIGAGAVVVKDIPKDCTAVGVPAKVIKMQK